MIGRELRVKKRIGINAGVTKGVKVVRKVIGQEDGTKGG